MHTLTDREKRTIRIGLVVLAAYLVLFYGFQGWNRLEARRVQYHQQLLRARQLRQELQAYEKKALSIERLRKVYQIDPGKLSKNTIVAEASAAIQKAASAGGVQLGPLRESSARTSGKELTSMQLEGSGSVSAMMSFIYQLERLGYPLILDSVQLTAESSRPGSVKVSLTLVLLDYEQWKTAEGRHA